MDAFFSEPKIRIAQAARLPHLQVGGRRADYRQLMRIILAGDRRTSVKLQATRIGRYWVTSVGAVERYLSAVSNSRERIAEAAIERSQRDYQAQAEADGAELEAAFAT